MAFNTQQSKEEQNYYYRLLNCPNWELERRRKIIDVLDETLQVQKSKIEIKIKERGLRWEIIDLKLKIMKQSSILFKKYLMTCIRTTEKSLRAYKTLSEEVEARQKEIKLLNMEIGILQRIRSDWILRLQKFIIVKNFLNNVREIAGSEYSSIEDIVQRFKFLQKTRTDQTNKVIELRIRIQDLQQELGASFETGEKELDALEKKILCLQKKNAKLEGKMHKLHIKVMERKSFLVEKLLELPTLEMQITDVFLRICKTLRHKPDISSTTEKLMFIQVAFKELKIFQGQASKLKTFVERKRLLSKK